MSTLILLVVLHSTPVNWAAHNKTDAQLAVLAGNVALGCLRAGIGMAQHDGNFFEGCLKGSISGAITFTGKWLATYQEYPGLGAVGKLVGSLGISMTDNVMLGEDWFSSYWVDLGPINLHFRRGSWAPDMSFTLTPMIGIGTAVASGYRFEPEKSLANLVPIFSMPLNDAHWVGYEVGQTIIYQRNWNDRAALSHEMVHVVQWSEFRACGEVISWGPWNVGQDLCGAMASAFVLHSTTYLYSPFEVEAYSLERGRKVH
jgi:hypothetical protein